MYAKVFYLLSAVIVQVLTKSYVKYADDNSLIEGECKDSDVLLYHDYIEIHFFNPETQYATVEYENNYTISCIIVQNYNKGGGNASVTLGGIGKNYVVIQMLTEYDDIYFDVQIFKERDPKDHDDHSLIVGDCTDSAVLLYKETFKKNGTDFESKIALVQYEGSDEIRCLKVIDLWADGTGGYVNVTIGGVGQEYVAIHLSSQKNRGIAFDVEIYA